MTRAWFRRRLEADPRRWALLLAALEGLAGFALSEANRDSKAGTALLVTLVFVTFAPAMGILGMLLHGRVLWWVGKVLGGRARPREIHAAFAWSQVPFIVAAAPLVLSLPFRAAVELPDPSLARDLLVTSREPLLVVASVAALGSAVLYISFLGEAQGFGPGRALANHLLAIVAVLVIGAAAVGVAFGFVPEPVGKWHLLVALATALVLAIGAEVWARLASRRSVQGSGVATSGA